MYDCKAPLSRFYYPDTRRIINAFIIIIIVSNLGQCNCLHIASDHCYNYELVYTNMFAQNVLLTRMLST